MESLVKSLLGKGQEHVYETMQNLIEDADKVKSMEIELQELKILLERAKDENEENKKKVKDLKDDLHHERDIHEELVNELKETDEENEHLRKCVKNRDNIDNSLEDMFKDQTDEIMNLRESCDSLARQVGKELVMENKLEIQNKIIDVLKNDLKEANDATRIETIDDIEKLMLDIGQLEKENEERAKQLEEIKDENEIIKDKLCSLEARNKELVNNVQKADDGISLIEELSLESKLVSTFECKVCRKSFAREDHMKTHVRFEHEETEMNLMKEKVDQLKAQIDLQKLNLTENLLQLNVREASEEKMCYCNGKCNIIHKIYNWRIKFGHKLHSKLLKMKEQGLKQNDETVDLKTFSCNDWGLSFLSESHLRKHMVTTH